MIYMNLPVASDEFINVIYRNILKALAVIYTLLTVMPTQCFNTTEKDVSIWNFVGKD